MAEAIEWRMPQSVDDEPSAQEALARHLPDLLAIPADQLLTINLDLTSLVARSLGVLPAVHSLLPDFARILPTFDPSLAFKLEDYAIILHLVHSAYCVAVHPPRCPPEMIDEGRSLRTLLIAYLEAHAQRGLVDRKKWRRLCGTRGFVNLATDLGMLAVIFQQTPALLLDGSGVTRAEVNRARELGILILTSAGRFRHTPEEVARAADLRQRAFTLVVQTYSAIRRAALYVRWQHDEGDELVPSLFTHRHARRRRKASTAESESQAQMKTQTQTQTPMHPAAVASGAESGDDGRDEEGRTQRAGLAIRGRLN